MTISSFFYDSGLLFTGGFSAAEIKRFCLF